MISRKRVQRKHYQNKFIYYWKEKIQYDNEYLCFFKLFHLQTKKELKMSMRVPEIIEVKIDSIDKEYLGWLIG
jgi:uncharacterized protein involved in tolerance to divalent cations